MSKQATIARGTDVPQIWMMTERVQTLLSGAQTHGELSLYAMEVRKGCGSPPHCHQREDEGFYILEGEITFLYGDQFVKAGTGSFVWGNRGVAHNFTGSSDTPAKALLLVTPSKFETFASGFSKPVTDPNEWPDASPKDIETILRTAPAYGIDILPPSHPMPTVVSTAAGASRQLWVMGEHVSYLATSQQTGGQFTVVEVRTAPAGGPPPHVHVKEDEIIYIIHGQHGFWIDGRIEVAGPGDLVYLPAGTRHRYSNIGTAEGKIVSFHTPGGFESFFNEVGVDAEQYPVEPKLPAPPPEAIEALLARHGMTV